MMSPARLFLDENPLNYRGVEKFSSLVAEDVTKTLAATSAYH